MMVKTRVKDRMQMTWKKKVIEVRWHLLILPLLFVVEVARLLQPDFSLLIGVGNLSRIDFYFP